MSWLEKILPSIGKNAKKNIPEGLWSKCPECSRVLYQEELERLSYVCPKCDHHLIISARRRLNNFLDVEHQFEIAPNIESVDPLKFKDQKKYKDRYIDAQKKTKEKDALQFYGKNLGLTFQIADDTLDYNSNLNLFGKKIGKDFFEGKVTLPAILVYQQSNINEKELLKKIFKQTKRNEEDFKIMLRLISKYNIIYQCYKKAEYFVNLASNSLSLFKPSKEKSILENLISFSLERSF